VGLDRKAIRGTWTTAAIAPIGVAAVLVYDNGWPVWWIGLGATGSVVSFGAMWLLLRRRYTALTGASIASREPIGRGENALRDRLSLAFFRHDPANLGLDDRRPVGYPDEVQRLASELPGIKTEAQLRSRIYSLLVVGFESAPPPDDESVHALAAEVWAVWHEWSRGNRP
jgi:hypothetical protein